MGSAWGWGGVRSGGLGDIDYKQLTLNLMSLLGCGRGKKRHPKSQLLQLFRERKPSSSVAVDEVVQMDRFAEQLARPIVSYQRVQSLAWNGVPSCIRPKIWKFLLKYMLINDAEGTLAKKRAEYAKLVGNYWRPGAFSEEEKKIYHTIDVDVKRIGVEYGALCRCEAVTVALRRLLFIWHNRHPASGYVQGMCDVSLPFLAVFLGEYLPLDHQTLAFRVGPETLAGETLEAVEADVYWCVSKMIEAVTSNYTQGFDGLRQAYSRVEGLLRRIDPELYDHFRKEKIDLFALSFRNISTMLLRLFAPAVGIRLFDTYIADEGAYPELMLFLFIAIVQKFAKKLLGSRFEDIMAFLQNLPTKQWTASDLQMLIAEAYCYQKIFSDKQ